MVESYLHICHQCPYRQQDCKGSCMCEYKGAEPMDIINRAYHGECPAGKFTVETETKIETARLKQGGCCGGKTT